MTMIKWIRIEKKSIRYILAGGTMAFLAVCGALCGREPATCKAEKALQVKEIQSQIFSERRVNVGSVSKVYTVTAVMQLVDQGMVDLDAPVIDYIPDFKMADDRYHKITVRMLMNHTSGMMGSVYGGMSLFAEADHDYHDKFLSHLQKEQLKYEPGAFNCYCNDGFTLLEILTERVSGMTFTDYLEEKICKPLSLERTGTMWNGNANNVAPIYVNGNVKMARECEQAIGAGGIISTASDICSFGTVFFKDNQTLLSERAKKEMAKNNQTGVSRENFGLGWDEVKKEDYENAGVTVLSKGGDTFYQNASLVVAPYEEVSVAVLASGGGSGVDEEIALALLDIALSAKGIEVGHPEMEMPELMDEVPSKYLDFEGLYADAQRTVWVSFPDNQYMSIATVTADMEFERQYLYAKDGSFVEVNGDVKSGKAIPVRPFSNLIFEEYDGQIYLVDQAVGCVLYKASANNVSDKVQSAWNERDDVTYYLVNGTAGDAAYSIENHCYTLHTNEAARGYVNGHVMRDEDHAAYQTIIPGTTSRDLSGIQVERVEGKEYLYMYEYDYRYVSEECIPVLSNDIAEISLKTKEASWFRIDGARNVTLRMELPEKAAVYVYDQYGNLRYSSYMTEYGYEVPLPEYGMIVFIGETGEHASISRMK